MEIVSEIKGYYLEAEQILRACIENHRQLTAEEETFLKTKLAWDNNQLRRQEFRIGQVLKHQLIAGTTETRTSANELRESKLKSFAKSGPKWLESMAAIKAKYDEAQREVDRLERMCCEAEKSKEHLTTLAPPFAVDEANEACQIIKETTGRQAQELAGEIGHMRSLSDPSLHRQLSIYLDQVRRYKPGVIENNRITDAWEPHRRTIADGIAGKEKELAELEIEVAAQIAEANAPLQNYWR